MRLLKKHLNVLKSAVKMADSVKSLLVYVSKVINLYNNVNYFLNVKIIKQIIICSHIYKTIHD